MGPNPGTVPPASTPAGGTPAFHAIVAAWLSRNNKPATEVIKVDGSGSDWAGDTEGGFYHTFAVEITWKDQRGATHYSEVSGDDMASLWEWVVMEWPGDRDA